MKTVKELLNYNEDKRLGNHAVVIGNDGRSFIYFNTVICKTDEWNFTFKTSHGGYATRSTTRAINSYIKELGDSNYQYLGEFEHLS